MLLRLSWSSSISGGYFSRSGRSPARAPEGVREALALPLGTAWEHRAHRRTECSWKRFALRAKRSSGHRAFLCTGRPWIGCRDDKKGHADGERGRGGVPFPTGAGIRWVVLIAATPTRCVAASRKRRRRLARPAAPKRLALHVRARPESCLGLWSSSRELPEPCGRAALLAQLSLAQLSLAQTRRWPR